MDWKWARRGHQPANHHPFACVFASLRNKSESNGIPFLFRCRIETMVSETILFVSSFDAHRAVLDVWVCARCCFKNVLRNVNVLIHCVLHLIASTTVNSQAYTNEDFHGNMFVRCFFSPFRIQMQLALMLELNGNAAFCRRKIPQNDFLHSQILTSLATRFSAINFFQLLLFSFRINVKQIASVVHGVWFNFWKDFHSIHSSNHHCYHCRCALQWFLTNYLLLLH